jgi:hypothetical protein
MNLLAQGILSAGLLVSTLGLSQMAKADQFNFTYTDGGTFSATGTLNATPNGNGSDTVTSGAATVTFNDLVPFVGQITDTLPLDPDPNGTGTAISPRDNLFDNQLFPTQNPLVDNDGLEFFNPTTSYDVNIFSNGPSSYEVAYPVTVFGGDFGDTVDGVGTLTVTAATPEPGGIALLIGLSVSSAGFLARRRRSARTTI